MKEEFFPKVKIVGTKLVFNSEAVETMELDVKDAKVILIETKDETKKREPLEILIVKTNGSLCDDPENIKDVFPADRIRPIKLMEETSEGSIDLTQETVDAIKVVFGDKDEFKLLACNMDSPLGKEFKEQFDITNSYYRFAYLKDKRKSIGKEKNVKEKLSEERISIN
jgi:hypothetical protein